VEVKIPLAPSTDKKKKSRLTQEAEVWLVEDSKKADAVIAGLAKYYREYVRPVEELYRFEAFHSPPLNDIDFQANPMVLLIGQYSTGKTTFINYVIEKDFQGMRIGPEPTTDRFTAVIYGEEDRVIPGNALCAMPNQPFSALQRFGMDFLSRFEASMCNSPILRKLTFIDTPGVLSGEKQRVDRNYNFAEVIKWFASRADRILLLFDANKLDISDEFKTAIEALRGNDDKVRCILNKADSVTPQQLMRVYGALMWSLGRVIKSPEVVRVFAGSFWSQPLQKGCQEDLMMREEAELLADLRSLPRNSAVRKINEFIKRARQVRVHALIIDHLRSKFGFFGKDSTQKELLENLFSEFENVQKTHNLPVGDFPHLGRFRDTLRLFKIWEFPAFAKRMHENLNWALSEGVPALLKQLPLDREYLPTEPARPLATPVYESKSPAGSPTDYDQAVRTPRMSPTRTAGRNPFDDDDVETPVIWEINETDRTRLTTEFYSHKQVSGKLSGAAAKPILQATGLSSKELRHLWNLCDLDDDGALDLDEFILIMWLIEQSRRTGQPLPESLRPSQVPPSKRSFYFAKRTAAMEDIVVRPTSAVRAAARPANPSPVNTPSGTHTSPSHTPPSHTPQQLAPRHMPQAVADSLPEETDQGPLEGYYSGGK